MTRIIALFCTFACTVALRKRKSVSNASASSFKVRTDSSNGVCAAHIKKRDLPIHFPLLCTGTVRNLKFHANADGSSSPRLRLLINGESKGYRTFPVFPATRTWTVSHDSLAAGLHTLRYSGDRLSLNWLEVEGTGGSCSFSSAAGYSSSAFTNSGLDVINRVVGTPRSFPARQKQQLHFAHETRGKNRDGSISASVVSDGVWEWMYMYSQEQNAKDEWLSRKERDGKMYNESNIKPYMKVALDQLPGRSGENMSVCEPCNTLSNIMFMEATVYSTCKGLPLSTDEWATLLSGFSGMGAGSAFFHASATKVGQLADVFGMELVMYQVHQLVVKGVLAQTGASLTQTERNNIMYLGKSAGPASRVAQRLTSTFRSPYDRVRWEAEVRSLGMPRYELSIVGIVLTVVEAMYGNWPIPGLGAAIDELIKVLLNALGGSDVEYAKNFYRPAIRKAFSGAKYCGSRNLLVGRFLKFTLTFVEAFMFQEALIKPPAILRTLFSLLSGLGGSGSLRDMEITWDIYNGQKSWCHNRSPHATWHEKAAHGLMHIENVAALLISDVRRSC